MSAASSSSCASWWVLAEARAPTTVALSGFANFGSIAILVGSLGALVPERRHEVAKYGLLALLAATMVNLLNAAVVGVVGS